MNPAARPGQFHNKSMPTNCHFETVSRRSSMESQKCHKMSLLPRDWAKMSRKNTFDRAPHDTQKPMI